MSADEQLVRMANDIGDFFRSRPNREEAVAGIANHVKSYWTRRMREKIVPYVKDDGSALDELPRAALRRLLEQSTPKPDQPPGGDAG
jgi:formate dehydrogenase subunit delta